MAETLVEKRVCGECGVDVRPNTAFCYNCGKSISPSEAGDERVDEASDAWFGETLVSRPGPDEELQEAVVVPELEEESQETVVIPEADEELLETVVVPEPLETQGAGSEADTVAETKPDIAGIDPVHHSLPVEGGLKSAASIRKRPKTFKRREVEVVWEKHNDPPTSRFILVTLIFVLFTIAAFLIAMQMK
jgi:hypothetical protein